MLTSQYHAVIFDLDGTLVDSRPDIAAATNFALQQCGLPALPQSQIVAAVGDGAYRLLERLSGFKIGTEELRSLYRHFSAYYLSYPAEFTVLYPSALETLTTLKDAENADNGKPVLLGLCTNKPRDITLELLDKLFLTTLFKVITAGDDFAHRKPHPEPLIAIAQNLTVPPEKMMMVGDGPQDVLCGKAVGAVTVGVEYGFKPEEVRAANPDYLIPSMDRLLTLPGFSGISRAGPCRSM